MKAQALTARDETILRIIYKYRYVTAREITKLLLSDGAHKHVLGILPVLAGGGDLQANSYLCRFCLPSASAGNRERIYTLGVKGRDFLAKEIGLPVNWYFRPYKLKHLSYSTILHNLILSRFVVSAQICQEAKVKEVQLSYELATAPGKVKLDSKQAVNVIPDAWIDCYFEDIRHPVLLEIDRGMEYKVKFKQHVRSRIAFIESGQYKQVFGTSSVRVAYITTGQTPEYRESRRKAMVNWTREVLKEQNKLNWSHVFYFGSLLFDEIYETGNFTDALWYRPDLNDPVGLFSAEL